MMRSMKLLRRSGIELLMPGRLVRNDLNADNVWILMRSHRIACTLVFHRRSVCCATAQPRPGECSGRAWRAVDAGSSVTYKPGMPILPATRVTSIRERHGGRRFPGAWPGRASKRSRSRNRPGHAEYLRDLIAEEASVDRSTVSADADCDANTAADHYRPQQTRKRPPPARPDRRRDTPGSAPDRR